ncbi:uncharacterized protein LOC131166021 [Malania oleifera]|uniref:uncharacterized protein LOC131166021 n=1 Tax=Malania oleifera TaxID=397392 RepID=UPI0025ADB6DA|nr:uncharacterized protein LOC131166021 [Malania oleifera]XP_057980223.1 uncharacterized protein LOC131166021 [Malania oleifera]
MWAAQTGSPGLPVTVFSTATTQSKRITCAIAVSAFLRQRRLHRFAFSHHHDIAAQGAGGLGRVIFSASKSSGNSPYSKSTPPNPTPETELERQLRGSDVLWALRRAADEKKKISEAKKKKKEEEENERRGSSTSMGRREMEDSALDYREVRPLRIKSDWKTRLDELGKRLQELSRVA